MRTGTASVSGTVVSDETNSRPLRHAIVNVSGQGLQPGRIAVTDDQGRFRVGNLPDGNFTVGAAKTPYVQMSYGQKRPGRGSGAPVAVAAGQQVTGIVIKLPRGAVITGAITDDAGQPYRGAQILVQEWVTINGQRTLQGVVGIGLGLASTTDDRGRYRAYGLPAGEYVVSASISPIEGLTQGSDLRRMTAAELQWANAQLQAAGAAGAPTTAAGASRQTSAPPPGQTVGMATAFFPGTTDSAAASLVKVTAGEERSGIDFSAGFVPVAKISGTVVGPDGQPVTNAQMMFANATGGRESIIFNLIAMNRLTPEGKFTSNNLPPGQYIVMARTPTPTTTPMLVNGAPAAPPAPIPNAGMWASAEVSINGQNVTEVLLTLQPGMKMSGRVMFEGPQAQGGDPTRTRVLLMAQQTGPGLGGSPAQTPREDGAFEILGISPGSYRLSINVPTMPGASPGSSWIVKSAVVGGRDAADSILDIKAGEDLSNTLITFTDKSGEVSGQLLDALGRPTTDYYALLYSTNKNHWFVGNRRLKVPVRPATDGRFRFTGLPPGEYFIAALTEVDQRDLGDTSFLEQVSASAIRFSLGEGEKKVQDLRLAGQ